MGLGSTAGFSEGVAAEQALKFRSKLNIVASELGQQSFITRHGPEKASLLAREWGLNQISSFEVLAR